MKRVSLNAADLKLSQRLLLVALTGTLPLFVVSLALITLFYRGRIEFVRQEQRGLVFQRPLVQLLDLVPRYQAAARPPPAGDGAGSPNLAELRRQIDDSVAVVAANYHGDLGRDLAFTDAKLALRNRDVARLSVLQDGWNSLRDSPPAAGGQSAAARMIGSIRGMIAQAGDLSNLILDDNLDSYYLMHLTVCALPQAQQRLGDITLQVGGWLSQVPADADKTQAAVLAELVQRDDQRGIVDDAQTSLVENSHSPGPGESLQANLPPAVARYTAANQALLALLKRLAAGDRVTAAEFEAAGWNSHAAVFHLAQVSGDELDRLLSAHIRAIQYQRLQYYCLISLTLVGAAGAMALIIRRLLNARYAELRHTEEELRHSNEKFRKAFQSNPSGMAITELETGRYIDVNESFARLYGFVRGELVGHTSLEMEVWANVGERNRLIHQLRADGTVRDLEMRTQTRHREPRTVLVNAELIELGDRQCVVSLIHDVTEQRRVEEQLRQAQKMDAIGTLAGGIAHDFNNILTAVIGYTELARRQIAGNPVAHEYLDAVLQGCSRAGALVGQILTFSRQQDQPRRPVQLSQVVAEPLKLLQAAIPSSIEFEVALAPDLPAVLADATQIHQVVMNLCTNAAHAMRDRPGRLGVRMENFAVDAPMASANPGLRPGPYVRLSVSDTGHGMDRAMVARIFEPFFTTKGPGEGTGLGLSLVHGIMRGHGGAVTVHSQPGQGTVFHLYFPATVGEVPETPADSRALAVGHGERILLVDDEEPLALLGRKTLAKLGYMAEARAGAAGALALVRANPAAFDLVITDLTMPGMLGTELARQLRLLRPDLPIILATGYTANLTDRQVRDLGICEVLLKPHTLHSLGAAVQRALATRPRPVEDQPDRPPH